MTDAPNKHDLSIAILRAIAAERKRDPHCRPTESDIQKAIGVTEPISDALGRLEDIGMLWYAIGYGYFNLTEHGRAALELIEHVAGCNRD